MKEFDIRKEDEGQTLIKYLQRVMPAAPSSFFYKMFRKKNIVLNGRKVEGREIVHNNDIIKVFVSDETFSMFSDIKTISDNNNEYINAYNLIKPFQIVYEDEHIIIADKPVGVLSQKAEAGDYSMNEALIGYLIESKAIDSEKIAKFKPSVCNRLDRNTGGLIMFAKTLYGANFLNESLRLRTVDKYYTTVVSGYFANAIDKSLYLKKDESKNKVKIYEKSCDGADLVRCEFFPVSYNVKKNLSKLSIKLHTGKSHQIRAMLDYMGYGIVGDAKYNSGENASKIKLKHHVLFCTKLVFPSDCSYVSLRGKCFEIDEPQIIHTLMK